MEDTDEFKWAVKVVIKRQMRDLMEQLRERGEEIAILTVNLEDNSCSHFGSPSGEWFVSEQKNLTQNFLNFCQTKGKDRRTGYTPSYSYYTPKPTSGKKLAGFKQKTTPASTLSSDMPLVKVTVPRHLAGDITEEELAGLVGRIVATHLAMQEKGDGSTGGTKFDLLLEAANQYKAKEELSSVQSTPSTRSARRRKVTARYKEGMSSLKKGKKSEEEDETSEQEIGHDEGSVIFNILAELSTAILKRVKVRTTDESAVDVEHSTLTTSDKFESLAVQIIQELDEVGSGQLVNKKMIKVMVNLKEVDSILIEFEEVRLREVKVEAMDDSDMEYLDIENDGAGEQEDGDDDLDDDDENSVMSQPDNDSNTDATSSTKAVNQKDKVKSGPTRVKGKELSKDATRPLKKRPKQKKSLVETQPTPCEHCGIYLAGKSNLVSHIRRVHLKQKDKKCTICGKGFWSGTARESHMLSVHTRRCEACQEYVVESVPWAPGMDMRQKRDVICTCGAIVSIFSTFGRKRHFLRDDEIEMEDEEQETQEKVKSTPGTKYACGTCGKLFMKKSNCERHSRAHTQIKSIECHVCGSQFMYENSLKKHMETEHGVVQHVCEVCGKNYSSETALKVHYVKFHAEENFTIGENLVMIVKEKGNDTADLEQHMEEIMEGEADSSVAHQIQSQLPAGTHIVTSEGNQVVVTHGEGGHVTLTTTEGHMVGEKEAAQIVQQVIQQGQMVAQEGNMSIIIKELPLEQME